MSRRKSTKGRPVSGILVFDKPAGLTSNKALQKVKQLFNARKAGHTGSLDPLATGVLPLCFGEATKVSSYLLDADKRYRVTGRLGVMTETGDAEGAVIQERDVPVFKEKILIKVINSFIGDIEQVPPMFSALKQNGKRLYELAREGIEVERKPRPVKIFSIDLLSFDEHSITLDVSCSKGTYIRTLIEDIGEELGCGAHVTDLRRTQAGVFEIDQAVTLEQLEALREQGESLDSFLISSDQALLHFPAVKLDDQLSFYIRRGQSVHAPGAPETGLIRLYDAQDEQFLGIGEIDENGMVAPKRLFVSAN